MLLFYLLVCVYYFLLFKFHLKITEYIIDNLYGYIVFAYNYKIDSARLKNTTNTKKFYLYNLKIFCGYINYEEDIFFDRAHVGFETASRLL